MMQKSIEFLDIENSFKPLVKYIKKNNIKNMDKIQIKEELKKIKVLLKDTSIFYTEDLENVSNRVSEILGYNVIIGFGKKFNIELNDFIVSGLFIEPKGNINI